jgi:hypothetical protein
MLFTAWFKVPGSRFRVEGKPDSRPLTLNLEPKALIRSVVHDFRSIVSSAKLFLKLNQTIFLECRTPNTE